MDNKSFFNYGDVVKLKRDLENTNLKAGDYGFVWAVYSAYVDESENALEFDYEGTFENKESEIEDSMFDEEDAEKVTNNVEASFSEDMQNLLIYLNQEEK